MQSLKNVFEQTEIRNVTGFFKKNVFLNKFLFDIFTLRKTKFIYTYVYTYVYIYILVSTT